MTGIRPLSGNPPKVQDLTAAVPARTKEADSAVPPSRHEASDEISRQSPPRDSGGAAEWSTVTKSGANPFSRLRRRQARLLPLRLSEATIPVDQELELGAELLGRMAGVLRWHLKHDRPIERLLTGTMMLVWDAQAAADAKQPLPSDLVNAAAGLLNEKIEALVQEAPAERTLRAVEERTLSNELAHTLRSHHAASSLNVGNIHAFVQRVLREAYLLQSETLADYAARVKHYNEMRKKTRELLEDARELQTVWNQRQSLMPEDSTYVDDKGAPWVELDENGEPYVVTTTEQEQRASNEVRDAAGGEPPPPVPLENGYDQLYGKSGLDPKDKDLLTAAAGLGDDDIKDHYLEDILNLLPKMSAGDLKQYLFPILDSLISGNSDEKELLQIFEALSPGQRLFLIAHGYEEERFGMDKGMRFGNGRVRADTEALDFIRLAREAYRQIAEALGAAPLGGALDEVTGPQASELLSEWKKQVRESRAAAEQVQMSRENPAEPPAAAATLSTASRTLPTPGEGNFVRAASRRLEGTAKTINTCEQLDAYIKKLEDSLNTYGEDGQLANVELQNALQRQQQTLQMMSQISKLLHDTAMSIIRKIS